jgi:hypothetical protein
MTEELDQLEVENLDEDLDSTQDVDSNEELTKAQEIAENQRIRAEKAEAKLKKLKQAQPANSETETPTNSDGLSTMDVLSLVDVPKEDREYLADEAKDRGKSISELLKDPYMKVVLQAKAEERTTAEATNTVTTKKGTRRDSDATLLDNFEKGIVPESQEGIEKLVKAQLEARRAKSKRN